MLDLQLIRQRTMSPVYLHPPPVLIGYFFISYYVRGQNTHFIPLVKFQLDQWPF